MEGIASQAEALQGFPLSPRQRRLWRLQEGGGESPYRCACTLMIEGPLEAELLDRALARMVEEHEIYRTTFERLPEVKMPLQVIHEPASCPPAHLQVCDAATGGPAESLSCGPTFDPARGPLLQAVLKPLEARLHELRLDMAALCADSETLDLVAADIGRIYGLLADGLPSAEDERPQMVDIATWQNEYFNEEEGRLGIKFWRKKKLLKDSRTELPFQRRRSSGQPFQPCMLAIPLPSDVADRLEKLSKDYSVDLETLLLGCWLVLIGRLTGRAQLTVGAVFNGRNYEELEQVLGPLARVLPLACRLEGDLGLGRLCRRMASEMEEAAAWQEAFCWERLSDGQDRGRDFFDIGFEFGELPPPVAAGPVTFSMTAKYACLDRFGVRLSCIRGPGGLRLELHYDSSRFEGAAMQRLGRQYRTLLQSALGSPAARLGDLSILSRGERRLLLEEFNAGLRPLPEGAGCLHEAFSAQAARQPEATALVYEGEQLSYAALERRSNRLAHLLRSLGVGPEVPVGLCLERSCWMMVGLLGILKAGGAYVALDPSLPPARRSFMLGRSQARAVLGRAGEADGGQGLRAVDIEAEWLDIRRRPAEAPRPGASPQHLAYVLFTSGSTGRPKGVQVTHRNLHSYARAAVRRLGLGAGSSWASVSTLAADLGNTSIFGSWLCGGALHLISQQRLSDGAALAEYGRRHRIDCLKIVPSHLAALLAQPEPDGLLPRRALVLGGEALSWELAERVRRLAPQCRVFNHYGPTESTVGVAAHRVAWQGPELSCRTVPLGRPLCNSRLYVADARLRPVATGVAGELLIGGEGLSRGYAGRAALTASRFLPDPFSGLAGERLYRSGDRVRHQEGCGLEFAGRLDGQVKVRGYRVELGEVESALRSHPWVGEAAVTAAAGPSGVLQLAAYVVKGEQAGAGDIDPPLPKFLSRTLPDYMVPSHFVFLDELPRTPNGKLDRQALPAPQEPSAKGGGRPPQTPVESMLAAIWCEVLGLERVGADQSFFDLGGHSLMATRLISRIAKVFGVQLPLRTLFAAQTLQAMAASIEEARKADRAAIELPPVRPIPREGPLPLSFAQQRLWFIHRLEPLSWAYNVPHALRLSGTISCALLTHSLQEIVRRHEVLRTRFDEIDGQPVQIVDADPSLPLPRIDLRALGSEAAQAEAMRQARDEARRPFDLKRGPLVRVRLLQLGESEHMLLATTHHIVSDFWSRGILVRELSAVYQAGRLGKPSPLPGLPTQYADFAFWQRQYLQGDALESLLAYWRKQLGPDPCPLDLPTDRPRPQKHRSVGARRKRTLSKALRQRLIAISRQQGCTLFMTVLAAFQALLHALTGREDFVIGCNSANRNNPEVEGLIGFFINALVLRADLRGDPDFTEMLGRARDVALDAYTHQDLPFDKLVEALSPQRGLDQQPLFRVRIDLQNTAGAVLRLPGLTIEPIELEQATAHSDLNLFIYESERDLTLVMEYRADLFRESTVNQWMAGLEAVLEQVTSSPEMKLSQIRGRLERLLRRRWAGKGRLMETERRRRLESLKSAPSG